jgi:hypothetical protein
MLAVTGLFLLGAIVLGVWAISTSAADGTLGILQVLGVVVIVPTPLFLVWVAFVRTVWAFRYRRAYGEFPVPRTE